MRKTLAALIAVAATTAALTAISAPAQAAGNPVILSPGNGAEVPSGFSSVSIDFSAAPTGAYDLQVACDDTGQGQTQSLHYGGSPTTINVPISPLTGPDSSCWVNVYQLNTSVQDYVTFTVAAPPPPSLTMTRTGISPNTFYPLVKDRYRDKTTASYTLNQAATVTAKVTDSKRRVVRKSVFRQGKGRRTWAWNGARNSGSKAPAGGYRLSITAKATGPAKSFSERVVVKTALVTRSKALRKEGDRGSFATSGSCYASRDTYDGIGELDCWGGNYAMASYNFKIPASAYRISWKSPGERTGRDICCTGSITKSGTRTSRTSYRIRAKVTGWRAYDVWYARVAFKYKKRI